MIGHLVGTVIHRTPQLVVLDVAGVGYEVHVPLSTFYEIERRGGDGPLRLFVHTHVREDALQLYGFISEREKRLFQLLIGVSGIGPRLAQVILSGMPPADLVPALAAGDLGRLTRIPGVGKKTAERLVLELRDKVRELGGSEEEAAARPATAADDLVLALVNLGYKEAAAERAVAEARQELPGAAFHELLRISLKRLARV